MLDDDGNSDGIILPFNKEISLSPAIPSGYLIFNCSKTIETHNEN